jgi:hypothetical protein
MLNTQTPDAQDAIIHATLTPSSREREREREREKRAYFTQGTHLNFTIKERANEIWK